MAGYVLLNQIERLTLCLDVFSCVESLLHISEEYFMGIICCWILPAVIYREFSQQLQTHYRNLVDDEISRQ